MVPSAAAYQIIFYGPVFEGVLQIEGAGFDPSLYMSKQQGLIKGYSELSASVIYGITFHGFQKIVRGIFVNKTIFFLKILDGTEQMRNIWLPEEGNCLDDWTDTILNADGSCLQDSIETVAVRFIFHILF